MNSKSILGPEEQVRKREKIIKKLLADKGIHRYEIFTGDEEASKVLPGGIYPYSGILLTDDGRVFSFWLDWDDKKQDYTLGDNKVIITEDGTVLPFWKEEAPSSFRENPAYQRAFQKASRLLGLTQ